MAQVSRKFTRKSKKRRSGSSSTSNSSKKKDDLVRRTSSSGDFHKAMGFSSREVDEPGPSSSSSKKKRDSKSMFDLHAYTAKGNRVSKSWGVITEPDATKVDVRGKFYMRDQKKYPSRKAVCPLVGAQMIQLPERVDHIIASQYRTWYDDNIDPHDENIFIFLMHLQVPSISASFLHFHALEGGIPINSNDTTLNKMLNHLVKSSDDWKKNHLKIIPRVVSGPYAVTSMIKNKPCILGTKVSHRYYRGLNYLEIDAQVDESYLSSGIIRMCHRFSTRIVVDMCWVIQGDHETELPERVIFGCTLNGVDFGRTKSAERLPKKPVLPGYTKKKKKRNNSNNQNTPTTKKQTKKRESRSISSRNGGTHEKKKRESHTETGKTGGGGSPDHSLDLGMVLRDSTSSDTRTPSQSRENGLVVGGASSSQSNGHDHP